MKCIHCQGEMKKGTTPFHVDRKGCHVLLDRVPAWVCQQCGEAYFEESEVNAIQDLIRSVEQKADVLAATA
jgi:YgiT-type zinc finger domain-containing protein